MEDNQIITEDNNNTSDQLTVTENMRSYIYDMAKWAGFLGYSGLIICIFLFIYGITQLNSTAVINSISLAVIGSVLIFYSLVFIYPSITLISYAKKANEGVLYNNQVELEEAMSKLKSFFRFYGILFIIGIFLNLLNLLTLLK